MPELRGSYSRWTGGSRAADVLVADLVGGPQITANPQTGKVHAEGIDGQEMSPDLARMIGVRLIEAAALADAERAIRRG